MTLVSGERGPTVEYVEDECTELGTPFLEVVRGAAPGPAVALAPGSAVIGRDDAADLVFAVDGLSRKHARIALEPSGDASIVDLSSRNGTFVNGRRVDSAALRDGDELRLGPLVLRLRYVRGRDAAIAAAPREDAPPSAVAGELSARELEVAQLVADGTPNAEIGAAVVMIRATVGRHLSNIYERLGIHSRAALTKLVVARGL
jgi:DNA-binding CsgD family transcriptional regulator